MSNYENLEPTEVEVPQILAAQVPGRSGADPASISEAMGRTFGTLMAFMGQHGFSCSGPPRAIYTAYGAEGVEFIVVMPLAAPPVGPVPDGPGTPKVGTIPGGKALRFTHRGPYRELMKTYGQVTQYMQAKGMLANEADWARYMPMWEEYLNDPCMTPEADLLTYIYVPLRA